MSQFIVVKVPHNVRTILKEWAEELRNYPDNQPTTAGKAFVSEVERLSKASAAAVSINTSFLEALAAHAWGRLGIGDPEISDRILLAEKQAATGRAMLVVNWCTDFFEGMVNPNLFVIHFPAEESDNTPEERRHV